MSAPAAGAGDVAAAADDSTATYVEFDFERLPQKVELLKLLSAGAAYQLKVGVWAASPTPPRLTIPARNQLPTLPAYRAWTQTPPLWCLDPTCFGASTRIRSGPTFSSRRTASLEAEARSAAAAPPRPLAARFCTRP